MNYLRGNNIKYIKLPWNICTNYANNIELKEGQLSLPFVTSFASFCTTILESFCTIRAGLSRPQTLLALLVGVAAQVCVCVGGVMVAVVLLAFGTPPR